MWCPVLIKSAHLLGKQEISRLMVGLQALLWTLQAGGNARGLQALLGYEGMAPVRQYLRWYDQLLHEQTQQETEVI